MRNRLLPPAAHTGGGAADGAADGREGVYQPTMPGDPAYMAAYDREFYPRAARRAEVNRRLTWDAKFQGSARPPVAVQELLDEAWFHAEGQGWDVPAEDEESWGNLLTWLDGYARKDGALGYVVSGWNERKNSATLSLDKQPAERS